MNIRSWVIGVGILLTGCVQQVPEPPVPPAPAATRVQPPDWFQQQQIAARAAKRNHQPTTDKVGAQKAYDDILRKACSRAALAGPGKYPSRCDAVLRPTVDQPATDPCADYTDDAAKQTECSD